MNMLNRTMQLAREAIREVACEFAASADDRKDSLEELAELIRRSIGEINEEIRYGRREHG
jgi:predicted HTH domain antitoxin